MQLEHRRMRMMYTQVFFNIKKRQSGLFFVYQQAYEILFFFHIPLIGEALEDEPHFFPVETTKRGSIASSDE